MRKALFGIAMLATAVLLSGTAWACAVDIDVKPGVYPNTIDLGRECELVVVMYAPSEDALVYADPDTAQLARSSGTRDQGAFPLEWWWEDENGDGFTDLVFVFSIPELIDAGMLDEESFMFFLIVYGEWDEHYPDSVCKYPNLDGKARIIVTADPLTIGDLVWEDLNGNGIQEDGEPGIGGVELTLLDDAQNPVATTTTDEFGFYEFVAPAGGNYTVQINEATLPVGLGASPTAMGTDTALDSNGSPAAVFLDCEVPDDYSIDFGYTACGPCDGKVNELTLRYIGTLEDAHVIVTTRKCARIFEDTLQPGDTFILVGNDKKGTLGTEITIWLDCMWQTKIHTSCSKPIGVGMVFGEFEVVAGSSRNGGALCVEDAVVQEPDPPRNWNKYMKRWKKYLSAQWPGWKQHFGNKYKPKNHGNKGGKGNRRK
ncbi:MAG: hypothetical protein GWP08_03555 [Nitrospiraceae bacterium]|nr:hypothetical protein [Nitrospiraceae bacterium]